MFKDYCPDWTEEQFSEAENIVSGIEYATLMTTNDSVGLEKRIEGALDSILSIYGISAEVRKTKISRVLEMNYRKIGKQVLKDFKRYVEKTNDRTLADLIRSKV